MLIQPTDLPPPLSLATCHRYDDCDCCKERTVVVLSLSMPSYNRFGDCRYCRVRIVLVLSRYAPFEPTDQPTNLTT